MAFALKGAGSASTDWSITANQSTFVLTTSTTAGAANDLAVLLYAVDNNQTTDGDESAVTGVTDSAGNFWQKAVEFTNGQGTAQTGATNGIWYCNLQNALAVGATVTLTFSNNTSRDAAAVSLTYFTKAAGFKASVEGTPGTLANDAANAGSLDVTTSNIACLRIRSIASETSVATAITKTAAFTAVLTQAISTGGAATSNQGVRGEYLISTATGAASAPTGGGGTVDHASVYVAFKETAFTVGDPPHNSDGVGGAQIAINKYSALVQQQVSASAGMFWPPTPRVADPVTPALTTGVPVAISGPASHIRRVYYQQKFEPPQYAQQAVVVTPKGWQSPLSPAPPVVKAQQGFSFVPFNTAQLAVNYTDFDWYTSLSPAPNVAKSQQGHSFVPFNTAQLAVNYTDFDWYGQLSGAPPTAKVQVGYSFVPFNTTQVAVIPGATGIPLDMGGTAPRYQTTYYQSQFLPPYLIAQVLVATPNGWQSPLSPAPPVAKVQVGYSFVPFNTAQNVTASGATGIPLDMGGVAPRYQTTYYQSQFLPPYLVTQVIVVAPNGWQASLSVAPSQIKQALDANQPFPFFTPNPVTLDKWQQPLSTVSAINKPQAGFTFVPFNTAQLAVNYTDFDWYAPLSGAPLVAKAQPGYSFVPFNTAQLAVNYTDFDWYGQLSGAPQVAKAKFSDWQLPYSISVVPAGWLSPLSIAPRVARAQSDFGFVPLNTAQLSVNYTDFDWYQPLSIAPVAAKRLDNNQPYPFYPAAINNTVTIDKWQVPLSTAPQVAKAQQGASFVPFNTAQLAVNYSDFDWYAPLSGAPPVAKAQLGYSFVPYNTAQVTVYVAFGWQQALTGAPPLAKAQPGFVTVPPFAASTVAAAAWQPILSYPLSLPKAQQGFAFVPFNTAQLAVNYTPLGWYAPLSGAPPVAKVQQGFLFVPFNTVQVTVYTDFYQQPLSVAAPVARAQQGFASVPFDTAQLAVNYTSFGWYSPLSTVARVTSKAAQEGFSSVPYNTPQRFAYSNFGWYQSLSTVPRVTPKGQDGYSFVPFNTPQRFAYSNLGWYCALSVPAKVVMPQQGITFVPFNTAQTGVTTGEADHIVRFIGNVGHFMLR